MNPTVRAGRPREFEPADVVAASMDVFWRVGYAAATLPQLSEATGVATSSIYNTFGSKREMYLRALDLYLAHAEGLMYGPMARGTRGLPDLESFLDRLETTGHATPAVGCLVTKATTEFGNADTGVAERTTRYRDDLRSAFLAVLTRAQDLGQLAPHAIAVPTLADLLVGIVLSFNMLAGAGAPVTEVDALIASARALVRAQSA